MKTGATIQETIKRAQLRQDLRQTDEQSLDERINRYLEIGHQEIIGGHYFAAASSECVMLYRDGHFISTVMVSQAVNEGILKFVAERNDVTREEHDKMVKKLQNKGMISAQCASASNRIWGSFRNDVHHMNPTVTEVPFPELAKRNLQDLALVEREIFGVHVDNGKLIPQQPKYWDIQEDGTVRVFLRFGI